MSAVKSSTATGTTATASTTAPVRGRFAPSPTGPLHKGSLVAALASWLDARARGGIWIIRMDDLDRPRTVPGAADAILETLARFGLQSDEPVLHQSTRDHAYRAALEQLAHAGLAYRCRCSRASTPDPYPGRCRDLGLTDPDSAWRLRLDQSQPLAFHDAIQGDMRYEPAALGDPVLYRRDGLAAYQLAVVVDDAWQAISDVVRGADLLESTAWQVAVADALGLPRPRYAHVPLITEPDGTKLAKSRRSLPVAGQPEGPLVIEALQLLGLSVTNHLKAAPVSEMLHWAVENWDPGRLLGIRSRSLQIELNSGEQG